MALHVCIFIHGESWWWWWWCYLFQALPGGIEAFDCRAPFDPDITSPLRPKLMFAIRICEGKPMVLCYSNWEEAPHGGTLEVCLLHFIRFLIKVGKNVSCKIRPWNRNKRRNNSKREELGPWSLKRARLHKDSDQSKVIILGWLEGKTAWGIILFQSPSLPLPIP